MPSLQTQVYSVVVQEKHRISMEWAQQEVPPQQSTAVVIAHGAGAGMDHPFIQFFHRRLAENGLVSIRFNFAYMEKGRKAPDRAPLLEATYRAVLGEIRQRAPEVNRVFIGGKSMGGRIASMLAASDEEVDGLYLLGYPLHPPHRKERLRNQHFPNIRCRTLFMQGTRDALCDLELLRENLPAIPGKVDLHIVEEGNHSFHVPKRSGKTNEEVLEDTAQVLVQWIQGE